MLSEAFLSTVMYQEGKGDAGGERDDASRDGRQDKAQAAQESRSPAINCGTGGGAYKCGNGSPCCQRRSASQAMYVASQSMASAGSPDLYTSWSSMYNTLYKNYPDLHIRGDHILIKKDSGCVLDAEGEDGPVLLSVDIDSSSPPHESLEGPSGEGALTSEESQVLPSVPFSNSAINGFLEKKMQELYKQCYEETLEITGPTSGLPWQNILVHINQMSLLMSQEKNLDKAKVKEAILQGLLSGNSSEFITPILHISSQDIKNRSGTLSNSAHLKKSSSVLAKK